jgi:PAS domain S-box-containing protein
MHSETDLNFAEHRSAENGVSGRFLTDFFAALERRGIPARELLGDLPVRVGDGGKVAGPVDWNHFVDFMKRLEHRVGGAAGIESCGEAIGILAPAIALTSLAGLAASPRALYRGASGWVLRRAMPGVETRLHAIDDGHLEIHARLADGLRPCPQIFHFATGAARVMPRLIGLQDAVVSASIGPSEAIYRIIVPPSLTLFARAARLFRAIFSSGSVLHYSEAQQLELHAKNDALQRAHDALAESEGRYKAITDSAVDVLCELDSDGRVTYVSRSVQDLIGYAPEQVTGSHFRLWIPRDQRDLVSHRFRSLAESPEGTATRDRLLLHAGHGAFTSVELTARAYDTKEGQRRIVCIARDRRARGSASEPSQSLDLASGHGSLEEPVRPTGSVADGPEMFFAEESPKSQWIETHKLMRSVRDMFLSSPRSLGFDLEIDLESVPAEIWVEESQLLLGLAGLLGWATERVPTSNRSAHPTDRPQSDADVAGPTLHLKAGTIENDGELYLVIDLCVYDDRPPQAAASHPSAYNSMDGELSWDDEHAQSTTNESDPLMLSSTAEAIAALGGRILPAEAVESSTPDDPKRWKRQNLRRIEIPQPRHT